MKVLATGSSMATPFRIRRTETTRSYGSVLFRGLERRSWSPAPLREGIKGTDIGLAYLECDYRELETQEPSNPLCTPLALLAGQQPSVFCKLQLFMEERYHDHP